MALIRAMNTSISGLRSQGYRIDTIGDNLANSTTTAFKTARVGFQTMLSQTLRFGTSPQGFLGGIDPQQIGLGVNVGSTTRNFNQGELENTGIASDLGIDGEGFFVLSDQAGGQVYSRDGAFTINPANLLHNPSNGYVVQGIQADLQTFSIASGAPVQALEIPIGNLSIAVKTTTAKYEGNLDGDGEQALSGTVLESQTFVDNTTGLLPTAADANTLLADLSRDTGGGNFLDLAIDDGDILTVDVVKGGRTLPQAKFLVGASLSPGFQGFGTTMGDFNNFLERIMGINTTGTNYGAIRDDDTNPNTPGIAMGATGVTASAVTVTGVNFATQGVQVGDFLRFNTGAGAGQIARITGFGDAVGSPVGTNDVLKFDGTGGVPFASGLPLPQAGDQFTIHEPAGIAMNTAAMASAGQQEGRLRISGNVGTSNSFSGIAIANQTDNLSFSPFSQIEAATGESLITNATFYDSNGSPHLVELTMVLETKGGVDAVTGSVGNTFRFFAESQDSNTNAVGLDRISGDGTVTFTTSGQFLSSSPIPSVSVSIPNTGAQTPLNVNLDLTGLTGFADQNSSAFMIQQDGFPTGTLSDFSIGSNGIITGIFDNGITRPLGQVYLARFANPNGLMLAGQNMYEVAANSGEAVIGAPTLMGLGSIIGGTLEASNVDFAREFTNLIVSQRAFQANARVISTADGLLEELVNIV
jgi:flagellar hook protein FlgE